MINKIFKYIFSKIIFPKPTINTYEPTVEETETFRKLLKNNI